MTPADILSIHTVEEAAAILRVKPSWLERQAAARKVPFTMLGGSYRFTAAHLAAIVQLHEQTPQPVSTAEQERSTRQRHAPASDAGPAGTLMQPLRPRRLSARRPRAA
jgi:excisionase family DNA binding protein